MCANIGFGCRVLVRRCTRSNISANIKGENDMEAVKVVSHPRLDPILEHATSEEDAHPKSELMYIIVIYSTYVYIDQQS